MKGLKLINDVTGIFEKAQEKLKKGIDVSKVEAQDREKVIHKASTEKNIINQGIEKGQRVLDNLKRITQ